MIREMIPKPIRKQLYRLLFPQSPVWWANLGPVSRYLANHIKPLSPPVVILSMPRSGSSWVGEMLGLAPNAMYLREPINKAFLNKYPSKPSDFEFDLTDVPKIYEETAEKVFSGSPAFNASIVSDPKQWSLSARSSKRLIIKEVNPFMITWLVKKYQPRIVLLLRHPVAITYSFERQGWSGKKFESRLLKSTLETKIPHHKEFSHSFWSEHGAIQAFMLNEVLEAAKDYKDLIITKYEDLCANPLNEYKRLYNFSQLQWNDSVEQKILERCNPKEVNNDFYSTRRNASYEMYKWKKEVPVDKILELKKAYLSFNPPYYTDDWPV